MKRNIAELILALPRSSKRLIALTVDTLFCILAVWFAFFLRLGEFNFINSSIVWAIIISVTFALPIFVVSGLYRAIFRYAGWPAILTVAKAMVAYSILYAGVITLIGLDGIPRTIGLIQPQLLFFMVAGSRIIVRFWLGGLYRTQLKRTKLPRALIYGAGYAGRQLATAMNNSPEMKIFGFLDDDRSLQNQIVNGKLVFPPSHLESLISQKAITHILLALPSVKRWRRNEILKNLDRHHLAVRTLPSMNDLAHGRVSISNLRELDIEDLLGRDPVEPDILLMEKNCLDKTVMITGAGGSIGSELCTQIINLRPKRVLLVEISEYALYSIHKKLEDNLLDKRSGAKCSIIPLIGSVQDYDRMHELMNLWKPETVYHAAAYKHVPMVEYNLVEGLKNNVLGTIVCAEVASTHRVSDFVLISTDKAVNPTNVMGASKRLAELYLQSMAKSDSSKTCFSIVRFGNVLGSSGSVIPRFRDQIKKGGPITLTHQEITRFFMTIQEAAQLVIQAGAMAKGGDVFVLNMGEPVKIYDLAKRMIELSGLSIRDKNNPDGDIEIDITGLRPGEKLFEELLLGDDPLATKHSLIMRAQDPSMELIEIKRKIELLKEALANNEITIILDQLKELVKGYKPKDEIVDWAYTEQLQFDSDNDESPISRTASE